LREESSLPFALNTEGFFASLRMTIKGLFPQPVKPTERDFTLAGLKPGPPKSVEIRTPAWPQFPAWGWHETNIASCDGRCPDSIFLSGIYSRDHGTAAYDTAKSLTLKGVVTSFEFINPHAEIRVAVTDENGRTVNWLAETNNPNRLARRGWNRNVLKTGDVITIVGKPVKSGAPSLRLTKVVLADGTELDPL